MFKISSLVMSVLSCIGMYEVYAEPIPDHPIPDPYLDCVSVEVLSSQVPLRIEGTPLGYGDASWPIQLTMSSLGEPERYEFKGIESIERGGGRISFGPGYELELKKTENPQVNGKLYLSGVVKDMYCQYWNF